MLNEAAKTDPISAELVTYMRQHSEKELANFAADMLAFEQHQLSTEHCDLIAAGQSRQQQQVDNFALAYQQIECREGSLSSPFSSSISPALALVPAGQLSSSSGNQLPKLSVAVSADVATISCPHCAGAIEILRSRGEGTNSSAGTVGTNEGFVPHTSLKRKTPPFALTADETVLLTTLLT